MKVLLINPWGIDNDTYYASGFVNGMNRHVSLDFACNYFYRGESPNGKQIPLFFRFSEGLKHSFLRKAIRGMEYILAWQKLLHLAQKNRYDIIHFHWLLQYSIDTYYLKKIKKYCGKLILTAHNVIPHVDGESNIEILRKIYGIFDRILVHGNAIREEFHQYYPEFSDKVAIQFHGEYYQQSSQYVLKNEPIYQEISLKLQQYRKAFVMFGVHFYNKGTDRLLKIWLDTFLKSDVLLIILGECNTAYPEMVELLPQAQVAENILVVNRYVEDNLLNYCVLNSDCIIIPYRHASMSGVVYAASNLSKPLLCTRSGAIAEYLEDGIDSILCEADDTSLRLALKKAEAIDRETFAKMGEALTRNIKEKYSWNKITDDLYHDVYCVENE